jgi:hypothetical protein
MHIIVLKSLELFSRILVTVISADFNVITLQGSQVLAGLGELALFHAFTDKPVNECALGKHEIELVV